jgi:hypothetical protein
LPFPPTGTIDVKAGGAEHVELFGPKALKVMVPVGDAPPARVAVSEIVPPAVAEGVAWVVMVGLALVTVTVVDPELGEWLPSPPYVAVMLCVPTALGV